MRSAPAGTMQAAFPTGSWSIETVTCVPRLGAILGTSASSWISSGRIRSAHTPVALITFSASTSNRSPLSVSTKATPPARPSRSSRPVTSAPLRHTAP